MRGVRALLVLAPWLVACNDSRPFHCFVDDQCGAGAGGGARCEPDGYCSFADSTCASGRRFGAQSPGQLANTCVAASTDDGGLEPGDEIVPAAASGDTVLDQAQPAAVLGGARTMRVDAVPLQNGLLRFAPSIPAGAVLKRAELVIHVTGDGQLDDGVVRLYAVTEAWEEAAATWRLRAPGTPWSAEGAGPASRGAQPIASFDPQNANRDYTVRLPTDLVARWISDPAQNHGMVLTIANSADQGCTFVTREDPDMALRPRLLLRYRR